MKRLALVSLLLAAAAGAQTVKVPPVRTVATLGACVDGKPKIVAVTDGSSATDCSSGGGSYDVECHCANGSWGAPAAAAGTVTSIAVSVPSALLTVSGTPVTTSGTFDFELAAWDANCIFAGPASGAAAAGTCRALVAADLPAATTSNRGGVVLSTDGEATAGEAVQATDARLTNARTPSAHASSHAAAGSDPVTLAQSQVTNLTSDLAGKAAASHAHAAGDITSGQLGVANGGTGAASLTAYAPVCGGTTSTGAVQSCGTGQSNAGYVYTSNGASAPPSWQAASGGGIGGSVGSTDNAIPRADGTGGATLQGDSLVTISDAGHMVFSGNWGFSGADSNGMRLTTTSLDTPGRFLIQDRLGTTPFAYNDGYVYSPGGSALFLGSDIFGTGLTVTGFAVTAPSAGVPASASAMAFSVFADRVQIRSGACLAWSTSVTDSDASSAATGAQICLTPTDTPPSCGDASRGAIYFDDSLGEHCGCRGTTGAASWQQLDGGGAC